VFDRLDLGNIFYRMAPLLIGVGNDISAAIDDGCVAEYTKGDLALLFGYVIDSHRADGRLSVR
jgi:hypothetical protein